MTNEDGQIADRRQRRDLQPPRAARRPGGQGPPLPQRQRLRGRRRTSTRRSGRACPSFCAGCSPSRCGTRARTRCCWRAIASARSRSTTCDRPDGFVFASELAALVADERTPTTLSLPALDAYLALQYVPAPTTIYESIQKLPPGTCSSSAAASGRSSAGITTPRLAPELADIDEEEAVASGARHRRGGGALAPDVGRAAGGVPVGRHRLVDRGRVHGARATGAPGEDVLGRLHAKAARRSDNELPFARLVAERYHTDHHELVVDPDMVALLAEHRAPPRRAVRRHLGGADALPVRDDPPPRDGRAVGRRRRRGVRRLPPLRLGARRRSCCARLPGPLAAAVAARCWPSLPGRPARWLREYGAHLRLDEATRYLRFVCHFSAAEKARHLHAGAARALRARRHRGGVRRAAGRQRGPRHGQPPAAISTSRPTCPTTSSPRSTSPA